MNELSLFTGAGGGLLGTTILGWRHVGYVEKENYCQKIIIQRIKDGIFDDAPIFGDIRTFISEGYAAEYQGLVDIITAGFPCQPFSVAGKQKGGNDARNMWPETIQCLRIIRPRFALLENVPGLLAHRYIQRIFGDLAESGYNARWCVLGADDVGAQHRRKRLWILADTESTKCERSRNTWSRGDGFTVSGNVSDSPCVGMEGNRTGGEQKSDTHERPELSMRRTVNGWPIEPDVGRVAHGVASRVDRLKAIGNGQVPRVVATAWKILSKDL